MRYPQPTFAAFFFDFFGDGPPDEQVTKWLSHKTQFVRLWGDFIKRAREHGKVIIFTGVENSIFASAPPLSLTVLRNEIGRNRLNWTSSNGSNTKTFKIYRATNGGSFSLLTTTTNKSYLDYAIVNGTNYSYKITENSLSSSITSQSLGKPSLK